VSAVAGRRSLGAGSCGDQAQVEVEGCGSGERVPRAAAIQRAEGGFYRGLTLEGFEVETVYKALPDAGGWSVHLGIPSDVLDRPVRRSFYAVAGGVMASLALTGLLTGLVSRDIARQRQEQERRAAAALEASEERAALAVEAAELGTWR